MSDHPRYELLEQVGQGDAGAVWRARDLVVGQEVAVKVLHDAVRADEHLLRPVLDGARFLSALDDREHFVRFLDLDESRGWLVMEYLPDNLANRARSGPMPADQVRAVLRQALEALAVLHGHGRLYGAVRPGNLLLTARGTVKLGEAPLIELAPEHGEVRRPEGLPKYFAPELTDPTFGPVGPPADQYSLGFLALELLVGPTFEGLFHGVGPDAADPEIGWLRVHGARDEELPATRSLVPAAPADLAAVIDRLLAREVKDRFASAEKALAGLKAEPASELPSAPAPAARREAAGAAVPPLPQPTRRAAGPSRPWWKRPMFVYPALGAIVAAALVMAVFFHPPDDEDEAALTVESTPNGAAIFVEGKDIGRKTNAELRMRPGKRVVRLVLAGHEPEERQIELAPGEKTTVQVTLRKTDPVNVKGTDTPVVKTETKTESEKPPPAEVVVKVTSKPSGAAVALDGEEQGTTPAELKVKPGPHTVRVHRKGYKDHEEVLEVKAGGDAVTVNADLSRLPAPGDVTNSIGLKLKRIDAPAEGAVKKGYYIGVYEVTQAQYEKVTKQSPSIFDKDAGGGPDHPVEFVSYSDAVKFCEALSALPEEKKAGRRYRLPTQAEWEHAARAGAKTKYHSGDAKEDLDAAGWFTDNSGGKTAAVGQKKPNAFGLYDMHGNVFEWCADRLKGDDGKPRHVLRGGSFNVGADDCALGSVLKTGPNSRSNAYGFRVVCEVSDPAEE